MLEPNPCKGDGTCLIQCGCECYDEETDLYQELCICGHRDHNGYCKINNPCCKPIKCTNCDYMLPLWVTKCNNGMCSNCASILGPHKSTKETDECPVCFDDGEMLLLRCKHKVCRTCWNNIVTVNEGFRSKCPLCRHLNKWGSSHQ